MSVNIKRLITFLLAVILVIGLPVSAMAATDDNSINETEPTVPAETGPAPMEPAEPGDIESAESSEYFSKTQDRPSLDSSLTDSGFVASELQSSIVSIEKPGEYEASSQAPTKYAYLGNCDQMDMILNDGNRLGWHFADEDQKYPWNYMNMVYCLEDRKQFSVGSGNSGDSDVGFDGGVTGNSTIGQSCWYTLSTDQRTAIALVIMYGCPTKLWDAEWGLNPERSRNAENPNIGYRFATQVLVWEFASGYRSATFPYELTDSRWYDLSVGMCMNAEKTVDHFIVGYESILNDLKLHNVLPSFTANSAAEAPSIELAGDSVTVTDANGILSRFDFTDTDTISYIKSENNLKITVSGEIPSGVQTATATLPDSKASLYELWYNGYSDSYQTAIKVSAPAFGTVSAYYKLKSSTGSLDLIKKTEDGKNLAGWKFGIYSDANCSTFVSGPHTTDFSGKISVTGLSSGTVYIKELGHTDAAIDALYKCTSTNPQKVTITSGKTAAVSFNNDLRTGYGKIVKETNTGENLSGWKFNVYTDAACRNPIDGSPFTTDSKGTITLELTPADYYVQEVDESGTNPDWTYDTTVRKLTVTADTTSAVTFQNTHYGYAQIVKQTSTGGTLGGWKFNIFTDAECTQLVTGSPFVSGEDGTITTRILPGTYFVVEVDESEQHPDWVFDDAIHLVTVEAGQTATVTIKNAQLGKAKIVKEMPDGGSIVGWEFDVYRVSDNAFIGTFTSGEDGTITTGYIEPGDYQIFEKIPGSSIYYCETENPQTVTVAAGQTASVTFTNRIRPSKIEIQKVDANGTPRAGAEFLLEWSEDGESWFPVVYSDSSYVSQGTCSSEGLMDGKLTSGEDGVVVYEGLHPELYYRLTETKAPKGLQLLPDHAYEGKLPIERAPTVSLTVVNVPVFTLPETGSKSVVLTAVSLGICLAGLVGAILYIRKKEW